MISESLKIFIIVLKYILIAALLGFAFVMFQNSFLSGIFVILAALALSPVGDMIIKTDSEGKLLAMSSLLLVAVLLMQPLYPS